jgi:hypothetical protein
MDGKFLRVLVLAQSAARDEYARAPRATSHLPVSSTAARRTVADAPVAAAPISWLGGRLLDPSAQRTDLSRLEVLVSTSHNDVTAW